MRNTWILALSILHFALQPLLSQTATGLNSGLTVSQDTVTNAFNVSWWGISDKIYYLQRSEDLIAWTYLPFLEEGADAALTWGLSTNADRMFFRLMVDDHPGGDPKQYDRDGDFDSDWDELQNGTDFHDYYNGLLPTLEIVAGGGQRGNAGQILPLPLTIMVADGELSNAPVRFSILDGGALISANGVSGWAASLELRSDSDWPALVRAYIKLPQQQEDLSTIKASVSTGGQTAQVQTWVGIHDPQLQPPTGLVVMPMGPDRIDLSWIQTHPQLPTVVEWSKDMGATWERHKVLAPGVTTLSFTGLEGSRYYKFRLRSGGDLP